MRVLLLSTSDQVVAVHSDDEREVLERVDVVALPRSRGSLLGAAPIAGAVLPVVGLGESRVTDGPALVIDGREGRFAWCVERVIGLVEVDPAIVRPLTASAEQPFEAVHEAEGTVVLHLARGHLEPVWVGSDDPTTDLSLLGMTAAGFARVLVTPQDERSVVVVRAADELVAIPLEEIFEIQTAESFVRLPVRDPRVVGLSVVRGAPTLALDLAKLIGSAEPSTGNVVLVVVRPSAPVALRVDAVVGLRRYDAAVDFIAATSKGIADGFLIHGPDGSTPLLVDVARTVDAVLDKHLQIAPIPRERRESSEGGAEADAGRERRLVVVSLAKEFGAIDADAVERVVDTPPVTRLRSARAPWLVGAVDVGGRVLPVCDVRTAFGAHEPAASAHLVLVRDAYGEVVVAFAVDEVVGLVDVDASHIEPFAFARSGPAAGVVRLGDGRIASFLRPEALLARVSASNFGAG